MSPYAGRACHTLQDPRHILVKKASFYDVAMQRAAEVLKKAHTTAAVVRRHANVVPAKCFWGYHE